MENKKKMDKMGTKGLEQSDKARDGVNFSLFRGIVFEMCEPWFAPSAVSRATTA